jgi:hypothetical protein
VTSSALLDDLLDDDIEQAFPGDPARFQATVDASRRLGVTQDVVRYQEVHVHVDEDRGREWFEHVFVPILQRRPETVHEIALGVAIRGTIAVEFYHRIFDDFGLG